MGLRGGGGSRSVRRALQGDGRQGPGQEAIEVVQGRAVSTGKGMTWR